MKKFILSLMGLAIAASAYAVTPADPTNVSWFDYENESGYSKLNFTLPTVDVDGNTLNSENMGYRVYLDNDQLFTFESSVYTYDDIYGDVTEIYYWQYSGGTDFRPSYIYFYRTNAEGYARFFTWRIGLQVFYVNDDNTKSYSNIVYDEVFPQPAALPKPANPSIWEWCDYTNGTSSLGISFVEDWDGDPVADDYTLEAQFTGGEWTKLDPEKLTYSLFTDNDEIFVFTPEEFPDNFTEEVTEIPYRYAGYQFLVPEVHFPHHSNITEGQERWFNWRIGMRANYRDGDQVTYSDIVYMEIFPQLKEAAEVTSTSFQADWICEAENTDIINNFYGDGCGYFLHVIDKATQEEVLVQNVAPANTAFDEWGNEYPLPGAIYTVEGLTPGATYEFYVVVIQNTGSSYQSVVREVTLPTSDEHFKPGDVNHDQVVDIDDVTAVIAKVLGNDVDICPVCADVNDDHGIDIDDVTAIINIILGSN